MHHGQTVPGIQASLKREHRLLRMCLVPFKRGRFKLDALKAHKNERTLFAKHCIAFDWKAPRLDNGGHKFCSQSYRFLIYLLPRFLVVLENRNPAIRWCFAPCFFCAARSAPKSSAPMMGVPSKWPFRSTGQFAVQTTLRLTLTGSLSFFNYNEKFFFWKCAERLVLSNFVRLKKVRQAMNKLAWL